jgi:hypothetical protein
MPVELGGELKGRIALDFSEPDASNFGAQKLPKGLGDFNGIEVLRQEYQRMLLRPMLNARPSARSTEDIR